MKLFGDRKYKLWENREAVFATEPNNYPVLILEDVLNTDCAVILGDPGSGKSHEAVKAASIINKLDRRNVKMSLDAYRNNIKRFFSRQLFKDWEESNYTLHLLVDDIDLPALEKPLAILQLINILKYKYKKNIHRLKLTLFLRSYLFSSFIHEALCEIWGENCYKIYELQPLSVETITNALEEDKIDVKNFKDWLEPVKLSTQTLYPYGYEVLLALYNKKRGNTKNLYFEVCRALCQEINDDYLTSKKLREKTETDQRMAIAGLIAIVSLCPNTIKTRNKLNFGTVPNIDILFKEIGGFNIVVSGRVFKITKKAIEETLTTGLFSRVGVDDPLDSDPLNRVDRIAWKNTEYTFFIASWYATHFWNNDDNSPVLNCLDKLCHEHKINF